MSEIIKTAKIEDIAKIYENLLGNKYFSVDVNCSVKQDGNVVQGIMYPARRPFSTAGLKAETMELSFEFYISVKSQEIKLDMLNTLTKIIGPKTGTLTSNGETFTYNSFLDFARPMTAPVVNMGDFTQAVLMTGSIFISNNDGGIKMSNDIITELTFNGKTARIYPQSINISNVRDIDAPTKANKNESQAKAKTQGVTRDLTFYDLRDDLCAELEKYIEIYDETSAINMPISIKRVYPGFTVTKECILTTGRIIEIPGSFMAITLTLQKK